MRVDAGGPTGQGGRVARAPFVALVALTLGSGATDAVAFLGMGGVFTANQTGNLVLVGLIGRDDYPATALRAAVSCAAFALALYAGFRLTRGAAEDGRPRASRALLEWAVPLQLLVLVGWLLVGAAPAAGETVALLTLSASAMGLQTVAAKRMMPGLGISTTFVTGTIVATLQGAAEAHPAGNRARVAAVAALVAGALLGAATLELVPRAAPVIPLLAVAVAIGALRARER